MGRPPHPDVLTPAEWRVLEQLREGKPNAEIAVRLGVSVNTVRYHVSNMLAKLDQPDRHALATWDGRPKRRFAWLPSLPPLPLALGGATRWIILGGTAGVAVAVVAALVLLTPPDDAPPRPTVAVYTTPDRAGGLVQLAALDPLTGALVDGAAWGDFNGNPGGFLVPDGSLIWYDSADDENRALVVADGARYGFASSGLDPDGDGIVREWPLSQDPGEVILLAPSDDLGNGWVRAIRMQPTTGQVRLSNLDLETGEEEPITDLPASALAPISWNGRLFAFLRDAPVQPPEDNVDTGDVFQQLRITTFVELDPEDGSELARLPFEAAGFTGLPAPGGDHYYFFDLENNELIDLDLASMTIRSRRPLPGGTPNLGPPRFLSPDGKTLYTAGDDILSCFESDGSCEPKPLGFHAIDLETMEVLHEEPGINHIQMSRDGRWLAIWRYDILGSDEAEDDGLHILDAATFAEVAHIEPGLPISSVAFSADGHYLYAVKPGPGWAGPVSDCYAPCTVVDVIDVQQREVIAEHAYDEKVTLYPLPPED